MGNVFLSQAVTTKKTQKFQHRKLRAISCEMQGWRKHMEDAMLFERISKDSFLCGVFDGHGGVEVAKFCSLNLSKVLQENCHFLKRDYAKALKQSFMKLDEMLESEQGERSLRAITAKMGLQAFEDGKVADSVGCTANVILIVENKIYVANAGDSRSVLSRKGKFIALSKDHKPEDEIERKRIVEAGGKVEKGRINGHLNLSRSIGDLHYKKNHSLPQEKQVVIAKPDVMELDLIKSDQFIIMGCDGVWERYENDPQGFVDYIRDERCKGIDPQQVLENYIDSCLAPNTTQHQNGCDNMTGVLIEFNKLML